MKRYRTLGERLLITALCLALYWVLSVTPLPGIKVAVLQGYLTHHAPKIVTLLSMISGNGLSKGSLLLVGIMPLMLIQMAIQLAQTGVIPPIKHMSESLNGNMKISKLNVILAVPVNALVAWWALTTINRLTHYHLITGSLFHAILVATTGGLIAVVLAELISLFGLGQGLSVLIAWGILLGLLDQEKRAHLLIQMVTIKLQVSTFHAWYMIIGLVVALNVLFLVMQLTSYKIQLQFLGLEHAEQQTGTLPFMLNVANIMPLIVTSIAFSVIQFVAPKLSGYVDLSSVPSVHLFIGTVAVMTLVTTFIQFFPKNIADNLQMNGVIIRGLAPGRATVIRLALVLGGLAIFNAAVYVVVLGGLMHWLIVRGFNPQLIMNVSSIMIIIMTVASVAEQIMGILSQKQRPQLITERRKWYVSWWMASTDGHPARRCLWHWNRWGWGVYINANHHYGRKAGKLIVRRSTVF